MSGLSYEKGFREFVVYQKSRLLAREIFMHTKFFPKDEVHFLSGQVRRASRFIGAHIAEAWANRRNEAQFINYLIHADGEQAETQHWLEIASDCGYMDAEASAQLVKRCAEIGRLLNGMIEKANLFCTPSPTVSDETKDYFIGTTNWSIPVNHEVE